MRLKRALCIIVAAAVCLLVSGCELGPADTIELLNPPALSGDISPINEVIKSNASGSYTLKYPSKGIYRSAVIRTDLDSDGILEAIAFYSVNEENIITMYMDVIAHKNDKWKLITQQKMVAGGVDKVEFSDLDGDGIDEIVVGWEIYGASEMKLAVYSLKNGSFSQRMLQRYTTFACCDINEDGGNEVFLTRINTSEPTVSSASVYKLTETGLTELYSCLLDRAVQESCEPVISYLSSGKQAIYIDGIKGIGAVTEVIFIEKNRMVNPILSADSQETVATLRPASLRIRDINDDGIIEIPIQVDVPSIARLSVNEKIYLTNWCSFNGENLTKRVTTMLNAEDGYQYKIPEKWIGSIAIYKDTDARIREIYYYDEEIKSATDELLSFRAIKTSDWESGGYETSGYSEVMKNGVSTFVCKISPLAEAQGITLEEIKNNFLLN